MAVLDFSDEQLQVLAREMPAIMRGLRDGGDDAAATFARLDDWCWHVPPCEPDEECVAGVPNKAMRAAARGDFSQEECWNCVGNPKLGTDGVCPKCGTDYSKPAVSP